MGDSERPEGESSSNPRKIGRRVAVGGALATGGAVFAWKGPDWWNQRSAGDQLPAGSTPTFADVPELITTVSDSGFDISSGPVRIHAPAGVADEGTSLKITRADHPAPSVVNQIGVVLGPGFEIILGNHEQPRQPITIEVDLSEWAQITGDISEGAPLLLASESGSASEDDVSLAPVSWDSSTQTATAVTEHLSFFGFFKFDIKGWITDLLQDLMGLTYPTPACAYQPGTISGRTYTIERVSNEAVWPCIKEVRDEIHVELHSNSILPWAVTTEPPADWSASGEFLSVGPLLAHIYSGFHGVLGDNRTAVMPGNTVTYRFSKNDPPAIIALESEVGLFLVSILLWAVMSLIEIVGSKAKGAAKILVEGFETLPCLIDVIRTTNDITDEQRFSGLVTSALSCITNMVKENGKKIGGLLFQAILTVIGALLTGAGFIAGAIIGVLQNFTGSNQFSLAITASGSELKQLEPGSGGEDMGIGYPMIGGNAAFTDEMPGPAPRLDLPIVVRWKYHSFETYRTQRIIVSDGGVFLNEWEHDHSTSADLLRLDAATGKESWRVRLHGEVAQPLVSDDMVFIGRRDETSESFFALDAQTGIQHWEINDPLVSWSAYEGNLYLATENSIRSINQHSQEQYWESSTVTPGSILIADDILVVTDGYYGDHQAFNAQSGERLWSGSVSARLRGFSMADGRLLVSDSGGRVFSLDAKTGELQWTFESGFGTSSFIEVVTGGAAYVTSGGLVHKIDLHSGNLEWNFTGNDTIWPVIVLDDVVYAGDISGMMYRIDATNGEQLMSLYIGEVAKERPTVVDGVVYCNYKDTVYAVGNLPVPVLHRDTTLRGAPSHNASSRGEAAAGTRIEQVGTLEMSGAERWLEVTIDGTSGWVPVNDIDPATLPQGGVFEYLYEP